MLLLPELSLQYRMKSLLRSAVCSQSSRSSERSIAFQMPSSPTLVEDVVGHAHIRSFSARSHPKQAVTILVTWSIANIRIQVFHNGTPEPARRVPWSRPRSLTTAKPLAHLDDDGDGCGSSPQPPHVRRRLPSCVDSIMVTTTDRDNRLIVLVAEFAVVEVVQVDGPLTADDANGVFVGAFPVFAEPATFPGDPCRAVHVIGIPTSPGPPARCPGRSRAGRAHVSSPRRVRRPPASRRRSG